MRSKLRVTVFVTRLQTNMRVWLGEVADPRPTCELIRQWSTFHPEFAFLPRKFKIAVSALEETDRAATCIP